MTSRTRHPGLVALCACLLLVGAAATFFMCPGRPVDVTEIQDSSEELRAVGSLSTRSAAGLGAQP